MTSPRSRTLSLAGLVAAGAVAIAATRREPALALGPPASAPAAPTAPARPTIVLVHGAFADGTGWQHVIPLLERDGYTVVAVQNPLTSFDVDVAATKRLIDAQRGPVIAVGHSYGGAVITGAAAGNPNVKALVYVAAFAPEAGEAIGAFGETYPAPLARALTPDAAGFLYVDRARFRDIFARDVPETQARVMAAAQKPVIGSVFGASVPRAAWKTIPSWYLVAQDDRAIDPALERFYARRMGATTTEVKASHAVVVSHPDAVARVIEQAAAATSK